MKLRAYQNLMVDHVVRHPRSGLFVPMGMGKTAASLTALDVIDSVIDDALPALVLAPKRVAQSVWPEEVKKWSYLRCSVVTGTPKERAAALREPADIYTINYDNLPWLVEHLAGKWPFRTVVADESTRLKSFRTRQGGVRARALGRVAHHSTRFINLTGTPAPNGLKDLWGQLWMLDRGERLGRTFEAFKSRWFQAVQVGADRHAIRLDPLPHAQAEITERISDICLSIDAKDWFDIRDPIVNVIKVDLPPAARDLYRKMERQMFFELAGKDIEAFDAAGKTMKCLQLASGAVYTDDKCNAWEDVHDAKIEALRSIVEESSGEQVLVAYHFRSDLERLLRAFPEARALDADPSTITEWNRGNVPILLAHPASAGHGLNLQHGGRTLVVFSHWWDLEQYQQIVERIGPVRQLQAGLDRAVFIHHIVAAGTIDEDVIRRRETKASVQDILMQSMKGRA